MVALPIPPEVSPEDPRRGAGRPFAALLLAWRRLVTTVFATVARAWRRAASSRCADALAIAARYVRDPAGTLASADAAERDRLREAGVAALALGIAASLLLPASVAGPLARRVLASGWTAAWAFARLLLMRVFAGDGRAERGRAVNDAWGPALIPYAAAVIAPLPLLALAASGVLTLVGLRSLGTDARAARRLVTIAFGAQLAAEIAAWLARGGLVYLLAVTAR